MDGAFIDAGFHDGGAVPVDRLPDRIRLPLRFDPERLAEDVRAFGDKDWIRHTVRQNYEGEWRIVPLRGPAGETHPIRMAYPDPGALSFEDTRFLDRAPRLREALGAFACPLRSVRLLSLWPGSLIREHCDPALDAESATLRLHVPIATSPDVEFLLNGRPVAMEPGSCWYLRLTDPHQAVNRSANDRIHLVVDAIINPWLDAMLRAGASGGRS
jgi:hypothetical protein